MSENSPRPENARDPDPDRTLADDGGLGDDPDATRDYGRSDPDATQVTPPDPDATRSPRGPDATRVTPVDPDAWRGRAGVPPTDPVRGAIPPQETEEWAQTDQEEPGRRWWLPILFGLLGVLLVLGIILAMVLANSDDGADNPTPAPSRTPGRTASAASVSPSAAPTVTAASPSIVQTATTVVVPETHGDTQAQATGKLEALGLIVRIQFQEDPIATPGTVLASSPIANSVVPSGSEIVLIIAKAIPSSAPSPVPASTRPAPEESRSPAAGNNPH
jgi:hypothetical protein